MRTKTLDVLWFLSALALAGVALYSLGNAILFVSLAGGPPVLTALCLFALWFMVVFISALLLFLAAVEERDSVRQRNAMRRKERV